MAASVAWKTFDTGAPASPIVSNGRFRLASPGAVLGSPSLAMQSAAQLAVVNVYSDDSGRIEAVLTVAGTTLTPIVNSAGKPFTAQQLFGLSIEVTGITNGEVLYTTDEPNGSPSAPFPDTTARNAAAPFVPGSTVYTSGAPTLVPWTLSVGATGETDADWVTTGVIVADDDAAEALMSVAGYGSSCQTVAGALWTSGAP